MKQKKWLHVVGLILLVLSGLLFLQNRDEKPEPERSSGPDSSTSDQRGKRPRPAEPDGINTRAGSLGQARNKAFRFAVAELSSPPENANLIEYPKYQTGGSGTRGSIRDQEGNLIFQATDENPVYSITISPNDELIWIGGSDKKSYIINTKGEEIANLPIVPPGKDMLGFGEWVWFDNHRLLGSSGVQKLDESGKLLNDCGGGNVSESRFYVYDLRTQQMEEMQLPGNLRGKAVRFGKVLKTGEIQLGHEGEVFAWYQVTDLKEKR